MNGSESGFLKSGSGSTKKPCSIRIRNTVPNEITLNAKQSRTTYSRIKQLFREKDYLSQFSKSLCPATKYPHYLMNGPLSNTRMPHYLTNAAHKLTHAAHYQTIAAHNLLNRSGPLLAETHAAITLPNMAKINKWPGLASLYKDKPYSWIECTHEAHYRTRAANYLTHAAHYLTQHDVAAL